MILQLQVCIRLGLGITYGNKYRVLKNTFPKEKKLMNETTTLPEIGNDITVSTEEVEVHTRYELAKNIMQGLFSENLVKNATVFPNWIENTDCFWYRRSSKEGREFQIGRAS